VGIIKLKLFFESEFIFYFILFGSLVFVFSIVFYFVSHQVCGEKFVVLSLFKGYIIFNENRLRF